MTEIIDIYEGKGKIKIKGNITDTYLYINGNPKIVSFFAEVGTVWRYLIGTSITEKIIDDNYLYESLVGTGKLDFNNSLQNQFGHILNLLSNGKYELKLCEFPYKITYLGLNNEEKPYSDTYGGLADILFTQKYFDLSVVEKYKSKIKKGERPICVLFKLQDSWTIFVIDGHHKLNAYKELKINPKALIISKIENRAVETNQGIEIMKKLGLNDEKFITTFKYESEKKYYERNFKNHYQNGLNKYFK